MALMIVVMPIFLYWQNNDIVTTKIEYKNSEIPQVFHNFKIAQVSDLHNKSFGKEQKRLIDKLNKSSPDIIVITGDLIDKDNTNIEVAMDFVRSAIKIAPIYYVSGNHEKISGKYQDLKEQLINYGVVVLDNDITFIEKDSQEIGLIGLTDVGFYAYGNDYRSILKDNLESLLRKSTDFSIVLSHRPEFISDFVACDIQLVFCGHAHGGQVRLPFIGGLAAPGQGLFPKYTSGSYSIEDTTMVISRGLGNSIFPFRVFNRPEIVIVALQTE